MKRPVEDASLAAAARSIWRALEIISSHMRFTCRQSFESHDSTRWVVPRGVF